MCPVQNASNLEALAVRKIKVSLIQCDPIRPISKYYTLFNARIDRYYVFQQHDQMAEY